MVYTGALDCAFEGKNVGDRVVSGLYVGERVVGLNVGAWVVGLAVVGLKVGVDVLGLTEGAC